LLSAVVLIVLCLFTLGVSFAVGSIAENHEQRLLHERTKEAAVVLRTLFSGPLTTLPVLATATRPRIGSTELFMAVATDLRGDASAIGALTVSGGAVAVLAVAGRGPGPGTTLGGARAALAVRATEVPDLVTDLIDEPSGRHISFAKAIGDGLVLYQDVPLAPFAAYRAGADDPFSELDGVVYAARHEDASKVVLATSPDLPLSGRVERQRLEIGADTWLLVTRSNHPLVGPFAVDARWWALAIGLAGAFLATGLVETLGRRRAYALALVDERTLALREALDAQAMLEQGQRQARELAEAANRSKSEFLSRMSHELRTPLNAVLGFGQLLELDDLTEPQQEAVGQIVNGGRHLLDLINEVLDLSRIETDSLRMSSEPVLVTEVVTDTLTLMRPLADKRSVEVVHEFGAAEHVYVLADRQRLKQILLNLVANGIKYNRLGGTVTVSSEAVGDRLRIAVTDTGPGIRVENLDRLFVPFERLGAERSDIEGAGVGLALSRRLAEAMGGTIEVASTYGDGSRFSVLLPLADGPLERHERIGRSVPGNPVDSSAGPVSRHKVLCIEDNLSNVRLIERILEGRADVEVVPAMQGRLALALAHEHCPALILLDLHLPDIDGDEVLRQLRDDPVTATTPVVIVSADATAGQIDGLLAAGASGYLTKPLDVHELRAVVAETIRTVPSDT
jgi:signal transduction histidine kinase/ActR/RegA family two-component response regulator